MINAYLPYSMTSSIKAGTVLYLFAHHQIATEYNTILWGFIQSQCKKRHIKTVSDFFSIKFLLYYIPYFKNYLTSSLKI